MPTLFQLQSEPAWQAEFTPPSLRALRVRLAQHFAVPLANIGTRGNEFHLSGYHRSRRWIKQSAYCVSRTYSVSRTPGDRSGGDDDAVSAMDITLPRAQLLGMCQRLDVAVRAGRLEKITEWYGNTDGDQRVDGYDNLSDRVASSDSSHLWHAHLSFDRGRVAEDHADLFAILTGVDDDMPLTDADVAKILGTKFASDGLGVTAPGWTVADWLKKGEAARLLAAETSAKVSVLAEQVARLTTAGGVDGAALKALLLDPQVLAAIAEAVADEQARRGVE